MYLDDILIACPVGRFHLAHLRPVPALLIQIRLLIYMEKCSLALPSVEYLGNLFSTSGIVTLRHHIETCRSCPPP